MTLAQRVRDQRYAKGWGPDELASRAAISRTALYQIESGKTEQPRAATLRRIAQALEIPTETLIGSDLGVIPVGRTAERPSFPSYDRPTGRLRLRRDDPAATTRDGELDRKFREVLASPLGEGVARIVEETHRILPQGFAEWAW